MKVVEETGWKRPTSKVGGKFWFPAWEDEKKWANPKTALCIKNQGGRRLVIRNLHKQKRDRGGLVNHGIGPGNKLNP